MQPPNSQNPRQRRVQLERPTNPDATYANTVMISHTQSELFLDFIQVIPSDHRARVQERIVMSPTHAKLFMRALEQNIKLFESKHGEITVPPRQQSLAEQLFKSIRPDPNSQSGSMASNDQDDDDGGDDDTDDDKGPQDGRA